MTEFNEMSGMEAAEGSGNENAAKDGQTAHARRRTHARRSANGRKPAEGGRKAPETKKAAEENGKKPSVRRAAANSKNVRQKTAENAGAAGSVRRRTEGKTRSAGHAHGAGKQAPERKTELHWVGRGAQEQSVSERLPLKEQVDRMLAQNMDGAQSRTGAQNVNGVQGVNSTQSRNSVQNANSEQNKNGAQNVNAANVLKPAREVKKPRNAAAQAQQRMLSAVAAHAAAEAEAARAAEAARKAEKTGNSGTALSEEGTGTPGAKAKNARTGRRSKKKVEHVKIIPLGGLEQIGMNITAFEYKDSIIVVDCGMAFPEDDMLGIDLIIPDVTYLKQNIQKVKGFYITHGHEDHIGALPYILREMNVPVYATRLTIALIENKLREAGLLESAKLNIVSYGDIVPAGDFKVEFIKTNHSIQDAAALAIHSPAGVIFHTGDFKVDYTPVFGDAIDLQRFAELGKQGVLALMADSTNALRTGFTMSERTVGRTFDSIFMEHPNNRLIVATFASNVDRVQQIINDAEKYGRKVVVEGRSMVNVIGTAAELGYIKIKENTLIDINQLKDYPDEKTVLVTTGSQGESMAALSRMASGQHRKVTIGPNDVIVLSSNPIPGNEKAVSRVINELTQKHATVIYQDTHVSGHACQEELKLIYALVKPKFAIPIHGEYRHRVAQKEVAMALGVPKENALIAETGDVIDLSEDGCKIVDKVQAGPLMVDGLGVGDVGNIVLHDRQNLGENGIIVVVLSLERYSGRLVSGPDIVSRGFVYVRENEDLMEEARLVVMDAVDDCLIHHVSDWGKIKTVIRDSLSEFIWRRLKRNPVILPIISEV